MKRHKPRLASDETVEIVNHDVIAPGLLSAGDPLRLPKTPGSRAADALRGFIGLLIVTGLVVGVTYTVLAATVMIVSDPFGDRAVVMRGTHPQGQVPSGEIVLASSGPVADGWFGRLEEGLFGVKAASEVVVVGGPAAAIRNDSTGQIVVDDDPTGFYAEVDARQLGNEYVAICLTGECDTGSAVIIKDRAIVGTVKGHLAGLGITEPKIPASITEQAEQAAE